MKIILASQSAGRKKILSDLGLKFAVIPAQIDEQKITASNHIALVKKIAKAKAETVLRGLRSAPPLACGTKPQTLRSLPPSAGSFRSSLGRRTPRPLTLDYLIIAADSMVYFQGKTYGKPKDKTEARKFLRMLSGQTHEFITGLCVIRHCEEGAKRLTRQSSQRSCKSKITFEKFTEKEIEDYVKIANVTSYAGGYAPDFLGGEIIRSKMKILGSKSNVLGGLPLEILLPILKENLASKDHLFCA